MSTKKETILVADDDPHLLRLVRRNLELAGFRVSTAADGLSALKLVEADEPDLLVLDIRMPGLDGYELCRRVREFSIAPIILLTARDAEEDKVLGLDSGADDYLTKPFSSPELLARVRAALRRAKEYTTDSAQPVFTCGELTVDFTQHLATLGGRLLNLTPTEYKVLAYLARNAGRVVTQQDLLTKVWGAEYRDEAHLLRVNIARLRRKVEPDSRKPHFIQTRAGIGYTLIKGDAA